MSLYRKGGSPRPASQVTAQSKKHRTETNCKKLQRDRKERLHSKQTSSQRGSFFGSSTYLSNLKSKQVKRMGEQRDGTKAYGADAKDQKRRNTRFGIVQAPRYHRPSIIPESSMRNKRVPENESKRHRSSPQNLRKGSISLIGLHRARKAQASGPFVYAKNVLIASLPTNSSWSLLFGKYGAVSALIGDYAVHLDQFRLIFRDDCCISEKDVPDFMVRRIFDTIDEDRHGEISAKQLSLWLSKDSGALTEGENSQIIQIRDIENKDDANPSVPDRVL